MFDSHINIESNSILPFIDIFGRSIPTYSLMIMIGLIVGGLVIILANRQLEHKTSKNTLMIIGAALVFGSLGAKIPIWISNYSLIADSGFDLQYILPGRTVVGGFIGGFLGVMLVKNKLGIKSRKGNQIALGVSIGMVFGRLGCFLGSCCYGIQANVPWAVNFGDGVHRHPTQIYEMIFHMSFFIYLLVTKKYKESGGKYLSIYFISYLGYRFVSEFIRIHEKIFVGLTSYQIFCVIGIGLILLKEMRYKRNSLMT